MLQATVRKNQYQDSVRLMQISRKATGLPGVAKVLALLGTASNKKVLSDLGLMDDTVDSATANDLVICIEADNAEAVEAALAAVDAGLSSVATAETVEDKPDSLDEAADRLPGANVAMISLPGQLAKLDVAAALEKGMHVMLFSDNISVADEAELKGRAAEKGLLLMGPDCGTAILNGVALAFANVVRRGDIGVAAASGTGIQEVTCLIDRFGGGISHAIGVGGRDLRREIGGVMMLQAIRTLADDPATRRLVLLSKPGDPEVIAKVLDEARATGLEVVACLLGGAADGTLGGRGVTLVDTLEKAAFAALGREIPTFEVPRELRERVRGLNSGRRFLRGLYSGGTLCYETLFLLKDVLDIESNVSPRKDLKLAYPARGAGHCCVDLGEDEFTQGRPHPMIDPGMRLERLAEELRDPAVKVVLLDVVLGYGAHRNPASLLAEALEAGARGQADGGPVVLVHVCGTEADPQGLGEQEAMLRKAGAFLFPTNAQSARTAADIIRGTL